MQETVFPPQDRPRKPSASAALRRRLRSILGSRVVLAVAVCLFAGTGWWWWKRDDPKVYFAHALDLMEQHSIRRRVIDWPVFRAAAWQRVKGARTRRDTHEALRETLRALGDHHSFLQLPSDAPAKAQGRGQPQQPVSSASGRMFGRIAYVSIPGYSSGTVGQNTLFATKLQRIVAGLEAQDPAGWIVDLRENPGGNMWPMLAGIGPVLGEGDVGRFVAEEGVTVWSYRNGVAYVGARAAAWVSDPPLRLRHPWPPVAVLTGPHTVSSGEAVAIAFRGRPDTRSFSAGTRGLSTGNVHYILSDGASLLLTTSTDADRLGRVYGDVIPPDEPVADGPEDQTGADPVVAAALSWLATPRPAVGGETN
ncbi:MAG: peptidase S41 [Verrucomicrobia bacterium]|nr:peptidase S41 [Verrucomicrobiota bacterium]